MTSGAPPLSLAARPDRIRDALLAAAAFFALAALLSQCVRRWAPGSVTANALAFLDPVRESTIGTLFSVGLLLAGAAVAAVGAARRGGGGGRPWWVLAAILGALALDEGAAFHEATVEPLRDALDAGGPLYYTWVVPGVAAAVAAGLLLRPALRTLGPPARRIALVGAILFVGGAVGFEFFEGWITDRHGREAGGLVPLVVLEETLEMVGATLFLYALMRHLAPIAGTFALR